MDGVRVHCEPPFPFPYPRTRAGESIILPQAVKKHTCLLRSWPGCRDQFEEIRTLIYPRQGFGLLFRVGACTGEGKEMGCSGHEANL